MALRGIDLSSNNHPHGAPIDWDLLAPEVDVVWVKASQYLSYRNPFLAADVAAAKAHGKPVGLYHFAGDVDKIRGPLIGTPDEESANFLAAVQGVPHDWLTLDYEPVGIPDDPAWVDRFGALTGCAELYSYASRLAHLTGAMKGRRRWVAAYQAHPPAGDWGAWQYTDVGTVPGVSGHVDLSHVYFDLGTVAAQPAAPLAVPAPADPATTPEADPMANQIIQPPWGPHNGPGDTHTFFEIRPGLYGPKTALVVSYNDAAFDPPWDGTKDGDGTTADGHWCRHFILDGDVAGIAQVTTADGVDHLAVIASGTGHEYHFARRP